jgi:hypothetical protein
MGASLEELEKAGLSELPPIAQAFTGASTTLSGVSTYGLFVSGGPFSKNLPETDFGALADAMVSATRKCGSVLDDVAEALVTTARDFARSDDEIAAAFTQAGGTLE